MEVLVDLKLGVAGVIECQSESESVHDQQSQAL